jgi:hypothetical protein
MNKKLKNISNREMKQSLHENNYNIIKKDLQN